LIILGRSYAALNFDQLGEKLPAKRFMRVHRSYIVSLDKINSITRNAMQIGKINITVGDQYKDAFNAFLSRWV
jgi:two-component system response regulator LytT